MQRKEFEKAEITAREDSDMELGVKMKCGLKTAKKAETPPSLMPPLLATSPSPCAFILL